MPGARPLLIVDAPSLLYRAFFALPKSIKGSAGTSVNALLGSANLILREVEEHDPRAVVLCFGPDAAEYRVELYQPYHAARPPVPDELLMFKDLATLRRVKVKRPKDSETNYKRAAKAAADAGMGALAGRLEKVAD